MHREMCAGGVAYGWGEYLLNNPEQGFCWISEYNGHFTLIKTTADMPRTSSRVVPLASAAAAALLTSCRGRRSVPGAGAQIMTME